MYILATDVLSCPRCGPAFGLILLSERMESRRVLEGAVACANCRERYPIRGGFADLRVAAERPPAGAAAGVADPDAAAAEAAVEAGDAGVDADAERAYRLVALLGITEGPALALVAGGAWRLAGAMADVVEHLEVIAVSSAQSAESERAGVTRIAAGPRLPFYDRSLRGVVLTDGAADTLLTEGVRVLAPLGRLVLEPAPKDARARVEAAGLRVLAADRDVVVAARQ
jgi:uncharacterized protein YbaR (Trm112 family)